jgi:putative DNA primase/helicase
MVISPADPYGNARDFIGRNHTPAGFPALYYHRDGFYGWDGAAYLEITAQTMRAELYEYLARCFCRDPEGKLHPVKPNKTMIDHHADALRAAAHMPDSIGAPAWLGQELTDMPADEILSLQNGLLHLPSKSPLKHTAEFFTYNALPFNYEPDAAEPKRWFEFLDQLWPNDQQSIGTLQEVFGLCLTDDTRFEKAFLLKGPKRSGKGTIGRVLRALIGAVNVAGPTLAQLGGEFGLQPLIGKRVAIISDARLGAKADHAVIAERLLSITGEDALDVNRKNRTFWHGHLKVRFIILTNELPRFTDASGALAGRFIVLRIVPSFYGNEDLGLTDRLLTELPGILLWSIAGWERLMGRGHFVQPDSAKEDVRIMEDLGSPVSSFLRDRCKIEAGWRVLPTDLYQAWCRWCDGTGRKPGTLETFGRDLRTALPGLKVTQPREGDERVRYYEGIRLL